MLAMLAMLAMLPMLAMLAMLPMLPMLAMLASRAAPFPCGRSPLKGERKSRSPRRGIKATATDPHGQS